MIYLKVIKNKVLAYGFQVEDTVLTVTEKEWADAGNDAYLDENGQIVLGVKNEQTDEKNNQGSHANGSDVLGVQDNA